MRHIRTHGLTFVTNNAIDFRKLFAKERLHAGLVILVPNVPPEDQRRLFSAVLDDIADRDLVNEVVEALIVRSKIVVRRYSMPA